MLRSFVLLMVALWATPRAPVLVDERLVLPTYTQTDWGARCGIQASLAACLLDNHFASLFPAGLSIGQPAATGGCGLLFESAADIAAFLPARGPAELLRSSHTNPVLPRGAGGTFAGALVAAKLNLAVARAGLLHGASTRDTSLVVLTSGVPTALTGVSIEDLVRLADGAIAGGLEAQADVNGLSVDVDGDGQADATPSQLLSGLAAFNRSYVNGRNDNLALRSESAGDASRREDQDVPTSEARAVLIRAEGSRAPNGRGVVRLRAQGEGRQRLDVKLQKALAQQVHELTMEDTPGSGRFQVVGTFVPVSAVSRTGVEGALQFTVDTDAGQRLPFGALLVADLGGRRLRVVARRQILFEGTVPVLIERTEPNRRGADDEDDD